MEHGKPKTSLCRCQAQSAQLLSGKDLACCTIKTDVDDGCDSQLDFLKPKFAVSAFPPSKSSPRELPLSKREGIPKLLCGISPSKKGFWIELPSNESSRDFVSNVE